MTTDREKQVLELLAEAFNQFFRLNSLEPGHPDDLTEFKDGIHRCQMIVAWRLARRTDPETWGRS